MGSLKAPTLWVMCHEICGYYLTEHSHRYLIQFRHCLMVLKTLDSWWSNALLLPVVEQLLVTPCAKTGWICPTKWLALEQSPGLHNTHIW